MCNCPSRVQMTEEHCLETFRRLDANGTGHITKEELRSVLGIKAVEAAQFVQEADQAHDNQISFMELVDFLRRELPIGAIKFRKKKAGHAHRRSPTGFTMSVTLRSG